MHSENELESAIKQLRRGRGLAVNAGAIGITLATADDPSERKEMAKYLGSFTERFCEVIADIRQMQIVRASKAEFPEALQELTGFAAEIEALDPADDFRALTRDRASQLTTRARDAALPAFYALIRAFEAERAKYEAQRARAVEKQAQQLEHMFGEVEDIGRMIHLISLNASVEAARAGGESGRSFKVIADEIRSLSAKSAELIDTTRDALRKEGGRFG